MAEIGEEINNSNLFQETDPDEWKTQRIQGTTNGEIDQYIYVGDIDSLTFSITVDVKDVTTSNNSVRPYITGYDSEGGGRNFRAVGDSYTVSGDTPQTITQTRRFNSHEKPEFIRVGFEAGIRTGSLSYRRVQVNAGDPEEWRDDSTNDGIVDLSVRYSPRVQAKGLGIYPLEEGQVRDFMSDLWNETFMDKFLYTLFGNPMESIISLRYFYGIRGLINRTQNPAYVTLGNLKFAGGTGVELITNPATTEYVQLDMGEVTITPKYNNFLDYSPHTSVQIYVPYYGFYDLNATEVMGNKIRLIYDINIITGVTLANIYIRGPKGARYRLLSSLNCEFGVEVPMNINAMESLLSRNMRTLASAGNTALGIGLATAMPLMAATGAGAVGGLAAGVSSNYVSSNLSQGNIRSSLVDEGNALQNQVASDMNQNFLQSSMNALEAPQMPTTQSSRSSGMSSETGAMSRFKPYILCTRPDVVAPDNYNDLVGTPDFTSGKISELGTNDARNYLRVGAISDGNYDIPRQAMSEIESYLKAGVYYE